MSPYLRKDAEISALARKLRGYSYRDLAYFPDMSPTHRWLVCEHLGCEPSLLERAHTYETQRRRAQLHSHQGELACRDRRFRS